MLGVSGTPVLDAVGKLGDLGDRLSDKTYAFCSYDSWTDDPTGRAAGWMRLLYALSTTIRSDGDYPSEGIPLRLHPIIRSRMAVDAISVFESTVRLVFSSCFVHCTLHGSLTDDPDSPSDGLYL